MARDRERRAGYRAALQARDLRLLLTSQLISSTGSWAYNVALFVYLYERTHSTAWVAAGSAARFLPALVMSAYGGIIAERFERRMLMVRVNLISFTLQLGLALVAWRHGPVAAAIAISAVTAIFGTIYNPAVAAMIPAVASEDTLAAANAMSATVDNIVVVLGPAVGAGLLVAGGPALAILANAVSFAVAAGVVATLRVRSSPSDVTAAGTIGPFGQVADGFRAITSSTSAATLVGFSVLASFIYGTDTVLFVPISRLQLHTGTTGYGYLLAGLGVGGVAGAALVNRLAARPRLAGAIFGGIAFYCVPTAALVLVHEAALGFALEVVRGAGTLVVDTLAITALQRSVPKAMVARVFGAFFALVLGAISLGALLTPVLLHAGLHFTLLAYGLGLPVLCLATLPRLIRMDNLNAALVERITPRIAVLERLDLFVAASRTSLEAIAEGSSEILVPAGTTVVEQGEEADALYAIIDGAVDVVARRGPDGAVEHLNTLTAGSYFGEIGLIAHVPRVASVIARGECSLLRIDGTVFLEALTQHRASPALLDGARGRLAVTNPAVAALIPDPDSLE